MKIDRRDEFKDVLWKQGHLIYTRRVQAMPRDWQQDAEAKEKTIAFAHFTDIDEGRSRVLLYQFKDAAECSKCIDEHNDLLSKRVEAGIADPMKVLEGFLPAPKPFEAKLNELTEQFAKEFRELSETICTGKLLKNRIPIPANEAEKTLFLQHMTKVTQKLVLQAELAGIPSFLFLIAIHHKANEL